MVYANVDYRRLPGWVSLAELVVLRDYRTRLDVDQKTSL